MRNFPDIAHKTRSASAIDRDDHLLSKQIMHLSMQNHIIIIGAL